MRFLVVWFYFNILYCLHQKTLNIFISIRHGHPLRVEYYLLIYHYEEFCNCKNFSSRNLIVTKKMLDRLKIYLDCFQFYPKARPSDRTVYRHSRFCVHSKSK
jgi:hypothetical protein